MDRVMAVAVAFVVLVFLTWTSLGQSMVASMDDSMSRWIGVRSPTDIVVITLDDRSIEQLGGWPVARSHYARLLTRLAQPTNRPRGVGLNILFSAPRPDDAELARAMQLLPVVLPVVQDDWAATAEHPEHRPGHTLWQRPVPVLADAASQAHVQMHVDSDGVMRSMQPVVGGVPHMAMAMVDAARLKLSRSPGHQPEIRVPMVNPAVGFTTVSILDALDPQFPLEIAKDKWVLIGRTSSSLDDMYVTPYTGRADTPTPGILVLASDLNALLHNDWLEIPATSIVFAFNAWLLAILVLFTAQWRPSVMLRMQIGIVIVITTFKILLSVHAHWWLNTLPLCLALPFGWLYWVTRKLEQTMAFISRQVQDLPQQHSVRNSLASFGMGMGMLHFLWPKNWRDPIDSISSELEERTVQMRESLRLLDDIVRQLPDALAVFDAHGQLVICNPSMRRYWAGQSLNETGSDPVMTLKLLRQTVGFDPDDPIAPNTPIHLNTPRGLLHCVCTENRIEGEQNIPLHLVRMHDITPLREQEFQRKKTLEFLSHDMRTPVAAIAAVAESLARKPLHTEIVAHAVCDIVQYTDRLMEMMDGFIDYSQATLAEFQTDLHLVSNLLDDALSQVQVLAEQQHMRFVVKETEYPLAIECNAHLIVRALVNTLVNALHHGQAGGEIVVSTELMMQPNQTMAMLEIRNQVGETPSHSWVRGFGLGLEFVRMVMERHGGTMTASWDSPASSAPVTQGMASLRLEIPNVTLDAEV